MTAESRYAAFYPVPARYRLPANVTRLPVRRSERIASLYGPDVA